MNKSRWLMAILVAMVAALPASHAAAQDTGQVSPQDLPQNGGAGIRTGHITSSGETVPMPGASQSGGTTSLDRGIQREDSKIESSICKGC